MTTRTPSASRERMRNLAPPSDRGSSAASTGTDVSGWFDPTAPLTRGTSVRLTGGGGGGGSPSAGGLRPTGEVFNGFPVYVDAAGERFIVNESGTAFSIAMLEEQADTRVPIGVPSGYFAEKSGKRVGSRAALFGGLGRRAPLEDTTVRVPPRYFEGAELAPATRSPEDIARLQHELVDAGLLKPGSYWVGMWDFSSQDAYATALAYANQRGETVGQTLTFMASLPPSERPNQTGFVREAFIRPDPATLREAVRAGFRSTLGRDPRPDELEEWAAELLGLESASHEREQDILAAQAAASATGAGTLPGGEFIDPVARFQDLLEQRYQPEIERRREVATLDVARESLFQSLITMGSMVEG